MENKTLITSLNNEKGAGKLIYNLANELGKKRNIDLLYRAELNNVIDKKNIKNIISLKEKYSFKNIFESIINIPKRLYRLYFILKKGKYKTVISNGDLMNIYFAFFRFFFKFNLVVVSHGSAKTITNSKIKFLYKILYRKATTLVTVSYENQYILENIGFHRNIKTIYNILDIKKIIELSKENISNNELKYFPKNKIKFIVVARLVSGKGIIELLYAFSKIKNKNYALNIIGDGPLLNSIKKIIKECSLEKNINVLGYKNNAYHYLKNSDILLSNSFSEALPTTLLEAKILNKHIISTNCISGPKEIIAGKDFQNNIKGYPYKNNNGILYEIFHKGTKEEREFLNIIEEQIKNFGQISQISQKPISCIEIFHKNNILKLWEKILLNN